MAGRSPGRVFPGIVPAACIAILLAPRASPASEPLAPPGIPYERAYYRTETRRDGAWVRDVETEIRQVDADGRPGGQTVRVAMRDPETVSVFQSEFSLGEAGCRAVRMSRRKWNRAGDEVLREEVSFVSAAPFPDHAYPVFSLVYVLRAAGRNGRYPAEITTVLPGGVLLGFHVKQAGQEDVRVPAGRFLCRKTILSPRLDVLLGFPLPHFERLVRPFLPKVYLWFHVEEPHVLVQQSYIAAVPPNDVKVVDVLTGIRHTPEPPPAPSTTAAAPRADRHARTPPESP